MRSHLIVRCFAAAAPAFAFALLLLAAPRQAQAYPQFQFSSGTQKCGQCHYAPAGFGLITSWGRDEAADTISRGGDGGFLHGAVTPPDWLALGGDVRLAVVRTAVGGAGSPELKVFPMQAEVYARAAFGDSGLSLYVAAGARGATREVETGGLSHYESFMSREHYLMWKQGASGGYVRAGRFYAPYGLRLAEHIYFVRQNTGFNVYEETYNLSGGYIADKWEIHVTGHTSPPTSFPVPLSSSGLRGVGGTVYGEVRFNDMAALGAQGRVVSGSEQTVSQGGGIGKIWVEQAKMLVMGEANIMHSAIIGGASRNAFASYFGLTFFPIKGIMAGIAAERYQEDMSVSTTGRNAFDLQINLFPWAHIEVLLLGRYQTTAGPGNSAGSLGMLQFHYYL